MNNFYLRILVVLIAFISGFINSIQSQCFNPPSYCNNITVSNGPAGYGIGIRNFTCGTINNTTTTPSAYPVYFDYTSTQIDTGFAGSVQNCSVVIGSGNYIVPKSTPFVLTGSATDIDGDALTYSWEETSLGTAGNWNSGNKNFFMSYTPTPSPSRLFPKQSVVLSGNYTGTKGEYVPATAQTIQLRLTARDNKMGGGGVCPCPWIGGGAGGCGPAPPPPETIGPPGSMVEPVRDVPLRHASRYPAALKLPGIQPKN